jgi:hypothetical protein
MNKLLADVLGKAREAVDYHRSGYDLNAGEFDANAMIMLMDELGIAVDACNVYPDDLATITKPDEPQWVGTATPANQVIAKAETKNIERV